MSCCGIFSRKDNTEIEVNGTPPPLCSMETFQKITTFIGALITLVGLLYLAGQYLPHAGALTPFLKNVVSYVNAAASFLEVNPMLLNTFIISTGLSFFIYGFVSMVLNCIPSSSKAKITSETD